MVRNKREEQRGHTYYKHDFTINVSLETKRNKSIKEGE